MWLQGDIDAAMMALAKSDKTNRQRERTIVITCGSNPTRVVRNGVLTTYPVPPVHSDVIVDTNGAGDAFVGGFLSHYLLGKKLEDCIDAGHYAARVVIQHSGCTFPKEPNPQYLAIPNCGHCK